MSFNYNVIYDFCKVRNNGTATLNGTTEKPPRVLFILNLLEKLNIKYHVETFKHERFSNTNFHNIYLLGNSNKWVMAHHDVCNHRIDNANDNSCSVINAIALKTLRPEMNIALVDGEEPPCMGIGSSYFSEQIVAGKINMSWTLNLELTGIGGKNFFIGNYDNDITKKIQEKFNCAVWNVPFNDAAIMFRNYGLNAALINPCPLKEQYVIKQVGKATIGNLWYIESKIKSFTDMFNDDNKEDEKTLNVGDILSKKEYETILKNLPDNSKLSDSDQDKFIVDLEIPVLEYGKMPTIEQMDTSILGRCHTSSDHVGNIDPKDMKIFVEEVLVHICDL